MKLKNLFLAIVAGAAALVSCEKELDLGPAKISVNPEKLIFTQSDDAKEVALLSTRDWMVSGVPDWIVLSATAGKASTENQTIKVSVLDNDGYNREAKLVFSVGYAKATLNIVQDGPNGELDNGDGTKEKPYNVAGVLAYLNELGQTESPEKVFVKGKICKLGEDGKEEEGFSTQYGNGTFRISDNGENTNSFYVYRVNYLGNAKFTASDTQIKVGDDVIIYGKVINYKGNTPETVQGSAFLYELNGVNKGGEDVDPSTAPESTIKNFIEKNDGKYYKLTGKVSNFKITNADKKYMSFDLTDNTATAVAYGFNEGEFDKWSATLNEKGNGGTVTLVGTYELYTNKTSGATTDEIKNITIVEFKEGQSTSDPKGTGTVEDPFNIDGAIKAIKDGGDKETTQEYCVKGKIATIKYSFSADPGTAQFTISDDGAATSTLFTCYSVYFLENKAWVEGNTQIKVGDEVIVKGIFTKYQSTYETSSKKAFVYSLNGKTSEVAGPSFGVKDAAISVAASATSATIKVTGNVAWTATSSDATVSPASGTGAADVTVTFAANTTEAAKTYKVTLATTAEVTTKSIEVTITQAAPSAGGGTSYVLDGDAIKSAHTASWSYTSGKQDVTATDGSVWTLFNTYANKNQVTVQMNKGKGAYVLTPELPAGMEVKTIAVVLNTKSDGTGNMGDRVMDIVSADGATTLVSKTTGQTLADGVSVPAGNTRVRVICNEQDGGAVYITSFTVTYGAAN